MDREQLIEIVEAKSAPEEMWLLRHEEIPFTVNKARTWHYQTLAKSVKVWREAGYWIAKQQKVPKMRAVDLHVITELKRLNRDYAAEALAAKAFVDGIVDAGVIPDDRPPHVNSVTFHAPTRGRVPALNLLVIRLS